MNGLDISKLYGSHENENYVIEYLFRNKLKTEIFRFNTSTQQSIHTWNQNGKEKLFKWSEYGISWIVKEIIPCEYTIREWTIKLLEDCGCQLNCYKDSHCSSKNGYADALKDLELYKEDNKCTFPFPVHVIAAELQAIGNEQPEPEIIHKKYQVLYDTDGGDSSNEFDDFESAKDSAISCLIDWICEEQRYWKCDPDGTPHPTDEQIESWDYMIDSCSAYVREWNEEEQSYYNEKMDYWFVPDEECEKIGWLEWKQLTKMNKASN